MSIIHEAYLNSKLKPQKLQHKNQQQTPTILNKKTASNKSNNNSSSQTKNNKSGNIKPHKSNSATNNPDEVNANLGSPTHMQRSNTTSNFIKHSSAINTSSTITNTTNKNNSNNNIKFTSKQPISYANILNHGHLNKK